MSAVLDEVASGTGNPFAFNIFEELSSWADNLEKWKQCALAKLVSQESLTDQDITLVFQEFLWDRGLDTAPASRASYTINAPAVVSKSTPPILLAGLKNVTGINALLPGQSLDIGPQLTVVYGPNGSGKSGYARALKSACFTRSKDKEILGNIHIPIEERPPVSAEFVLEGDQVINFVPGEAIPALFDNFAVFDSSCIHIHTDERKQFVVTPYLFDVFPRLAKVIAEINSRVKALEKARQPDLAVLKIPEGTSEVAHLLNNLTHLTDHNRIVVLGTLSDDEHHRVLQLEKDIAQLQKEDPSTLLKKKSAALADLALLSSKIRTAMTSLSQESTKPISDAIVELISLREQARAVSLAGFANEPVQPIGSLAWKALLSAALSFNDEVNPGHDYPAQTESNRCVLCQQVLDIEAKDRLHRFRVFIKSDLETKIKVAVKKLDPLKKITAEVDLVIFDADSALRRTADELHPDLSKEVDRLLDILADRKTAVLHAIASESTIALADASTSVFKQIKALSERLDADMTALKTKNVTQLLQQYKNELTLLIERKILASRLPQVLLAIDSLAWLKLAASKTPASAKAVTDKQKTLMDKLVGSGFRDGFRENCKQLGFDMPLNFKIRGAGGATDRQLEFSASESDAELSEVLSEGEQTVVALADFLTEVGMHERPVGVIFDDPVSSMDHLRKELIAKRLVQEAKVRQVIIFTHDILFSHHLAHAAENAGGDFSFVGRTVVRNDQGQVGCIDSLLFPHANYENKAVNRADDCLTKAKNAIGAKQNEYLEKGCGCLRTAYEDFIQRKLFGDVVNRWREQVKFTLISDVYVPDDIVAKVELRMATLSRYIDGHSHSDEYHEVPLTTALLQSEIDQYRLLVRDYSAAKKAWGASKGKTVFE
jgi:DNA-binding NarL/FixJ family response regulator